jgi:hypothetical protein
MPASERHSLWQNATWTSRNAPTCSGSSDMLGQLRHARCEAGFRRAASEAGLTVHAPHTNPAGGRYSLIIANDVCLIRSNIQRHCGTPRPTAFRKAWSALNRWLDPLQLNLLQPVDPPPADRLCGMIVITANPRWGDPSVPSFVGLGIPRADLSDWVDLKSLSDLLARYHDPQRQVHCLLDVVVGVKDNAVPRLKRSPDSRPGNSG